MTNEFKITEPGFYRRRDGGKVQAMISYRQGRLPLVITLYPSGCITNHFDNGRVKTRDSTGFYSDLHPHDIVAKWEEPAEVGIPTTEERNWKRDALYYEACLCDLSDRAFYGAESPRELGIVVDKIRGHQWEPLCHGPSPYQT